MGRKAAIDQFFKDLDAAFPGHGNRPHLEAYLNGLDEAGMEQLVQRIERGEFILPLTIPNLAKVKLDQQTMLDYGKAIGHDFFEQIWMADPLDPTQTYLTPRKYLVVELPLRRQAQTLDKKMSVPLDDSNLDDLTGQPTGESKGSAISFPELQVLYSEGLEKTITELIKVRGGDIEAYTAMDREIVTTGGVELGPIEEMGTRPKTTKTLASLLTAAHLGNNL